MTTATEHDEAIEMLREVFPKGSTVYTILRHVSRSGMTRDISLVSAGEHPQVWDYYVARVLGMTHPTRSEGVRVRGTGMNMGFHLVYRLGHALYSDGYALRHAWL